MASNQPSAEAKQTNNAPKAAEVNAAGIAKGATTLVGNTVSGVTNTAGSVFGALGRGLGDTITGVAGEPGRPVGNALSSVGNGVEGGAAALAKGAKDAGQWK